MILAMSKRWVAVKTAEKGKKANWMATEPPTIHMHQTTSCSTSAGKLKMAWAKWPKKTLAIEMIAAQPARATNPVLAVRFSLSKSPVAKYRAKYWVRPDRKP